MALLTTAERAFVLAIAPRFVPAAAELGDAEAAHALTLIEHALEERTPAVRRQFSLLLTLVRWAPAVRYGRPLDALDPATQDAWLRRVQDAPFQTLRAGFWGLRTLIFLGFYGRPQVAAAIGYHPSRDGHERLHARTSR